MLLALSNLHVLASTEGRQAYHLRLKLTLDVTFGVFTLNVHALAMLLYSVLAPELHKVVLCVQVAVPSGQPFEGTMFTMKEGGG